MAQAYVYEDDSTGWRHFQNGDLPTSGVTAGTYGDGTHVGQFTVNAQGIITAASSIATGGGGSGSWVLIFGSVLAADAASIDTGASAIASTYTHLVVIIMAKSDSTATTFPLFTHMAINGDGGLHYESSAFGANVNTLSSGPATNGISGLMTDLGTGQLTTSFAPSTLYFPQYANTAISKSWTGTSHQVGRVDAANNFSATISGLWSGTAAINQIAITPATGTNFKAGSSMHVYGIT